jgi:hypothetical protein
MSWSPPGLVAVALLGALAAPVAAEWRCRQGRVELIVGGTQGCVEVAQPEPAGAAPLAPQRQRDLDRRAILETEIRQEQAALAALQRDGRPADPATRRRVQDNIDALMRELARTASPPPSQRRSRHAELLASDAGR